MPVPRGAVAGCCQSAVCALELACWAAGCGCRVLLSKGCLHLRNWGAATAYCCQSAVCAMKLGCWFAVGWLQDVYGSVGVWPWWNYVYAVAEQASAWLPLAVALGCIYAGVILGSRWEKKREKHHRTVTYWLSNGGLMGKNYVSWWIVANNWIFNGIASRNLPLVISCGWLENPQAEWIVF